MTINQSQKSNFSVASNPSVNIKLNKQLLECIDINNFKYTSVDDIVDVLKNKQLCAYQSRLIKKYCQKPQKYLGLELDKLTVTVDCTPTNIKRLLGTSDKKNNLTKIVKAPLNKLAKIKRVPVGLINRYHASPKTPYYSMAYRLEWIGDKRKNFTIQISEASKSKKEGKTEKTALRFDFIPARFDVRELQLIFQHIASKLGEDVYHVLMNEARVTRLDHATYLPGVFRPFVYQKTSGAQSFSEEGTVSPETSYFGKIVNSHRIQYDKILKEARDNPLLIRHIDELCAITRLEYCYRPNKDTARKEAETPISPVDLSYVKPRLNDMEIIDPKHFYLLPRKVLVALLQFKNIEEYRQALADVETCLNKKGIAMKSHLINTSWCRNELEKQLEELQTAFSLEHDTVNYEFVSVVAQSEDESLDFSHLAVGADASDKQQKAIRRADDKRIVVNAGAGAGKTRCLAARAQYLVDNGAQPGSVYLVTFTNDARDEMKRDMENYEDVQISTLNALAQSIATAYLSIKPTLLKGKARESVISPLSKDFRDSCHPKPTVKNVADALSYFYHSDDMAQAIERKCPKQKDLPNLMDLFQDVLNGYEAYKQDNGLLDYDDQIRFAYKAAKRPKANMVLDTIRYLLVDEMQDLSPLEWKLIFAVLKRNDAGAMFVGDHAQAIFDFKGGRSDHVFEKEPEGFKFFELTVNHRCSAPIVNLANTVLHYFANSTFQKATDTKIAGLLPVILECTEFEGALNVIGNEIRTLRRKAHSMNQIVLIVTTNKAAIRVKEALEKKQISVFLRERNNDEQTKVQLQPKPNQVVVTNVHLVKGGAYERVYFFDPRLYKSRGDTEENELALVYVAITRAITHLTIVKSDSGKLFYSGESRSRHYVLDTLQDKDVEYRFV